MFDDETLQRAPDGVWRASLTFASWEVAEGGAPYAFVVRTPGTGIDVLQLRGMPLR